MVDNSGNNMADIDRMPWTEWLQLGKYIKDKFDAIEKARS